MEILGWLSSPPKSRYGHMAAWWRTETQDGAEVPYFSYVSTVAFFRKRSSCCIPMGGQRLPSRSLCLCRGVAKTRPFSFPKSLLHRLQSWVIPALHAALHTYRLALQLLVWDTNIQVPLTAVFVCLLSFHRFGSPGVMCMAWWWYTLGYNFMSTLTSYLFEH